MFVHIYKYIYMSASTHHGVGCHYTSGIPQSLQKTANNTGVRLSVATQ